MNTLKRFPVPVLKSRNSRIGTEGRLRRSWSVAPHDFFRIYRDEPLVLDVETLESMPSPIFLLNTNLNSGTEALEEIPFVSIAPNHCRLSVQPSQCGIFQFKLRYSPDGGATWYWDRTLYAQVIVDPPAARDIRLYTLIPTASGHIGLWKKQLTRIRDMGFNMVHFLPLTAMGRSESPYSAADLFSVDASYLDPDDPRDGLDQLEALVEEMKRLGLRLCVDLVLNHVGHDSLMATQAPEWIVADENQQDGLMRAGCWHMNNWIRWEDLVRINYDVPIQEMRRDLWNYMEAYAMFWANYAAYTGGMVRLDNLHSSHEEFAKSLLIKLRGNYPDLVVQAEFFSDSNTILRAASETNINLFLANPWEHPLAESLREYLRYLHGISSKLRHLTSLNTHDTGAVAQLYGNPEALVPRYFVAALMSTGQTGLVQGAEDGVLERIEFIGRGLSRPRAIPDRYRVPIARINGLLAKHPVFHQGGNLTFADLNHGAVLAAFRKGTDGIEQFLLCANLDAGLPHDLWIDCSCWHKAGQTCLIRDRFTDKGFPLIGPSFHLELKPLGVRAFMPEYQ